MASIDLDFLESLQQFGRALSLCTRLEKITLPLGIWDYPGPIDPIVAGLCTILSYLHGCSSLHTITLPIFISGKQQEPLRRIFTNVFIPVEKQLTRFSSLTKFQVEFPGQDDPRCDWYTAFIKEFRKTHFPTLYDRGLLD